MFEFLKNKISVAVPCGVELKNEIYEKLFYSDLVELFLKHVVHVCLIELSKCEDDMSIFNRFKRTFFIVLTEDPCVGFCVAKYSNVKAVFKSVADVNFEDKLKEVSIFNVLNPGYVSDGRLMSRVLELIYENDVESVTDIFMKLDVSDRQIRKVWSDERRVKVREVVKMCMLLKSGFKYFSKGEVSCDYKKLEEFYVVNKTRVDRIFFRKGVYL